MSRPLSFSTSRGAFTVPPDGTGLQLLLPSSTPADTGNVRWSPSGDRMAFVTASSDPDYFDIYLAAPDGSGRQFLVRGNQPRWSGDGQSIYFVRRDDNVLRAIDVTTRSVRTVLPFRATVSPDGRTAASVNHPECGWSNDGRYVIALTSLPGGTTRCVTPPSVLVYLRRSYVVEWQRDGRLSYPRQPSDDGVTHICLYEPGTGCENVLTRRFSGTHQSAVLSPSGSRFAVVTFDRVYVVDANGSNLVEVYRSPGGTGANTPSRVDWRPIGGVALPPPCDTLSFDDVCASSTHAANIERLIAAGITSGCGDGRFCPGEPVSRGQMATFLARALDL